MPPKKSQKLLLSDAQKLRREFARRRIHSSVILTEIFKPDPGIDPRFLPFASFEENLQSKPTKKKAKPKKLKKPTVFSNKSPVVSDVEISSDEDDAGNFKVPEKEKHEEELMKRMNEDFDSIDDVSLEVFNNEGVRVNIVNGKHVIHPNQPASKWIPPTLEDDEGNYPMMNKPHKKKHFLITKKLEKPKKIEKVVAEPPKSVFEVLRTSIMQIDARRERESMRPPGQMSFSVFGSPSRMKLPRIIQNFQENRLSMFNYTPIRGNRQFGNDLKSPHSTIFNFSPKIEFASTPIEKTNGKGKGRKTSKFPVFEISTDEEATPEKSKPAETEKSGISENSTKIAAASEDVEISNLEKTKIIEEKGFTEILEEVPEEEENENSSYRKAEISVAELLMEIENDGENDESPQEDSQFSKKRQRTKSPETMCHGTTMLTTVQNEPEVEIEENNVRKRTTLQPQQKQLDRESRISRISMASVGSVSIHSAMEEMSLDPLFDRSDSYFGGAESRPESRNVPTGMTIMNEDPSILPFYLADGSFDEKPSAMEELLHVVGQKEPKTWNSLPKGTFDGRKIKKLGEGAYGEVFSTNWNEKPVAIKVVPFEPDAENRQFHGEYHSGKFQSSEDLLPEVIVMKELSELKNMSNLDSTPNFIELVSAEIVRGKYPKGMLTAWTKYAENKESENTDPVEYSTEDLNSILFVAANGGIAVEDFRLKNEEELRSILIQLVLSMVAAESALEFEHRDLHLGNVLIDRNGVETLDYKIGGRKVSMRAHGVKVNIIDFTLSRIKKGPTTVFLNLENDPDLFTSEGNPQFDVYREMRKNCGGKWEKFEPKTNLMWIEFIANQLIDTDICPKGVLTAKRKKTLRELFKRFGQYDSCGNSLIDVDFYEQFYEGYFLGLEENTENNENVQI